MSAGGNFPHSMYIEFLKEMMIYCKRHSFLIVIVSGNEYANPGLNPGRDSLFFT